MFTSRDVARIAGVSQSTVSYVMSGKRPISEPTRRRVLDVIDQLTYRPHAGARSRAGRRTQVIGLVVPFGDGADTQELLPFIEPITEAIRQQDYDVLLVTANEGAAALTRLAGRMLCDGILLMEVERHDERVPVAAGLRLPVVLIGIPEEPRGLCCVDLDFRRAGLLAAGELVRTGHTHAVLLGPPSAAAGRDFSFLHALRDGAAQAAGTGRMRLDVIDPVEPGQAGVRDAAARILALLRPGVRTGVIGWRGGVLRLLMDVLTAWGVRPGQDISVIGVCPDELAAGTEPQLTNVSAPPGEIPRRAVGALFERLEGDPASCGGGPALIMPQLNRRATVLPSPAGGS